LLVSDDLLDLLVRKLLLLHVLILNRLESLSNLVVLMLFEDLILEHGQLNIIFVVVVKLVVQLSSSLQVPGVDILLGNFKLINRLLSLKQISLVLWQALDNKVDCNVVVV
jgi:hypothetical protein